MKMDEINSMPVEEFVARVGWVFENSPWVAERAAAERPFSSLDDLCEAMNAQVSSASREERRALLCAHPDLGTRARVSASSAQEQSGAGLDCLTSNEYDHLLRLNAAWKQRFGFPFLYAVKGSDKHAIIEALELRLQSAKEEEFIEALRQVFRIARFRLEGIVT